MVLPNWLTTLSVLGLLDSVDATNYYDTGTNVTLGSWAFNATEKDYWQYSDNQENLFKLLGGMGPYSQATGFGVQYTELPESLELDRVFLMSRHGERYPTKWMNGQLNSTVNKLKAMDVKNYTGPLAFVEDWEYFIEDPSAEIDHEVNNTSPYSGISHMRNFGKRIRERYGDLYNEDEVFPIFSSGQQRVVDSAKAFSEGFSGHNGTDPMLQLVVLPEEDTMGYNTLTTSVSCLPYDEEANYPNHYIPVVMDEEAKRLNKMSPGFSVNATDVENLINYCAYEINAKGHSDVCDAISLNAFIEYEYVQDLIMWYGDASNAYSFILGAVHLNATLMLLNDDSEDQQLWLNFAHDTDILYLMNAIGLFDYQTEPLSLDHIDFDRFFSNSELIPMGANIIIERIKDKGSGEKFLRVIVNDAVFPLKNCQDGPYMTCKLETLMWQFYTKLARHESFKDQCEISDEYPQELTFYWDWQDGRYNETSS